MILNVFFTLKHHHTDNKRTIITVTKKKKIEEVRHHAPRLTRSLSESFERRSLATRSSARQQPPTTDPLCRLANSYELSRSTLLSTLLAISTQSVGVKCLNLASLEPLNRAEYDGFTCVTIRSIFIL